MRFIGERVRAARVAKELTQQQLADAVGGINRETVNRLENGQQAPRGETIAAIASTLNVPMESFFEDEVVA